MNTLRESHRTRTVFRKAGGFVYVVSVLISMEGALSNPPRPPWDRAKKSEVFTILKTILNTLTVSMRYEPANAKFFETEVKWKSLCAALKLLGCFDASRVHFEPRANNDFVKRGFEIFEAYFCNLDETYFDSSSSTISNNLISSTMSPLSPSNAVVGNVSSLSSTSFNYQIMNEKLIYVCYILRFLYDTALDSFDK